MTANDTRSPEEIEREIRRTQRDMSRTVDDIGDQLTPRNLLNALLDKADENGVDARYLIDGARRNPLALGMIAIGAIWLVSDSDARASTFRRSGSGPNHDRSGGEDTSHREYVEHMSLVVPQAGEDELAYRRRRDCARASYLMIEQRHDEDESGFRKRLDEATDRLRERRERMAERTHEVGRHAREYGSRASETARRTYSDNPMLGGLAAALVGAIAGSALPLTRTEEEQLGGIGERALNTARDKTHAATDRLREKKDEVVDKADAKMREGEGSSGGQQSQARTPELSAT